jgi:hypothetical protein
MSTYAVARALSLAAVTRCIALSSAVTAISSKVEERLYAKELRAAARRALRCSARRS